MLACSKLKNGKSVNALSLPLPLGAFNANALSTDTVAWRDGNKYNPKRVVHYPAKDMKWGLVALRGALHTTHIDAHGVGTFVEPLTGAKWWIMAVPLDHSVGFSQFADVSQFFSEHFDLDKSGEGLWRLEAVLLTPGSRLYVFNSFVFAYIPRLILFSYMRPNTPHAVFTPDHTICEGGHFFTTSTMADTFYGIVHAFVADSYITNTSHPSCWLLLRRIMQLYYIGLVEGKFSEDGKYNILCG